MGIARKKGSLINGPVACAHSKPQTAYAIFVVMITRIRLARENDTARLSAVERSAAQRFKMVPGLEWVAEGSVLGEAVHLDCIRAGTCWVAVDELDSPVGFLSAEAVAERELHIREMSVHEAFQGYGIGRALLEAAIEWAAIHHLAALTLTTFHDVPWNAPFYSRIGFKALAISGLDERLSALLREEVEEGFVEGTRCAMRLSLDDAVTCAQRRPHRRGGFLPRRNGNATIKVCAGSGRDGNSSRG